jgi:Asp-tRNA(Asn)/Glu-tRNA(Gln) amidotransferase A subunit family amidase
VTYEFPTLVDQAEELARGSVSAVDSVAASLDAIADRQPRHNAFVMIHDEGARVRAASLVRAPTRGPLHGVPLAIKDNIDEAGVVCSAGCRAYDDRIPSGDAPVVAALRAAGAVVVGRCNMNELADGVTGENVHHGDVHNPARRGFRAGGSSAGSAVAVADGSVAAALGTDTGGSVRIPAALCGVVGFKPSAGLLSTAGTLPLSTTLDHVGLLTRTPVDAVALLDVLLPSGLYASQLDDRDPGARPRIGVLEGFGDQADAGTALRFEQALRILERSGGRLRTLAIPELSEGLGLLARIYGPEAAELHGSTLADRPDDFGAEVRRDLARGARKGAAERRRAALARREEIRTLLGRAIADVDLLVSPTTPLPATPHGAPDPHRYLAFTCPFNITGQPALSVPMGEVDGLPVGLQLVGRPGEDLAVLRAGIVFRRELSG